MRRVLMAAGAAAAAVLIAGCGVLRLGGSGDTLGGSALPAAFGPGGYRLRGHTAGYSAEVIVKQTRGGIAVLAVAGAFSKPGQLCAPGLSFVLNERGSGTLKWTMPAQPGCFKSYASSDYLVCLTPSDVPAGAMPKGDRMSGCDHPVLPAGTGVNASLTAKTQPHGSRRVVNSVGIILRPRSRSR